MIRCPVLQHNWTEKWTIGDVHIQEQGQNYFVYKPNIHMKVTGHPPHIVSINNSIFRCSIRHKGSQPFQGDFNQNAYIWLLIDIYTKYCFINKIHNSKHRHFCLRSFIIYTNTAEYEVLQNWNLEQAWPKCHNCFTRRFASVVDNDADNGDKWAYPGNK